MLGFSRFLVTRAINMVIVLFATLVITLALLGSSTDKLLIDSISAEITMTVNNNPDLKFSSPEERQQYIKNRIDQEIRRIGLDESWYSPKRLSNTLLKVMALDLGNSRFIISSYGSSDVSEIILERAPKTILLFTTSTIVVTAIGIYLGAYLANKSGSVQDRLNSAAAVFTNSFPTWWVGLLMIFAFAFAYQIFPARATPLTSPADPSYIFDLLYHMLLPFITIIMVGFTSAAYFVRYYVSRVMSEDYITAKRTAGIPERRIVYAHALKNAAPPIVTAVALGLAGSFSGALTIEAVFDWPGLGSLYYEAILTKDTPLIIGLTYVSTLIFVVTVFVTDMMYAYFDPRVKVG